MDKDNWCKRVEVELHELNKKIERLCFFIEETDVFQQLPDVQKQLLLRQLLTMKEYSLILSLRVYLSK